jgi:hypothetical protein
MRYVETRETQKTVPGRKEAQRNDESKTNELGEDDGEENKRTKACLPACHKALQIL